MNNIGSLISNMKSLSQNPINQEKGYNPFLNPYLNKNKDNRGKNMPIQGGFFGGYTHSGKPIILGSKLFIEV